MKCEESCQQLIFLLLLFEQDFSLTFQKKMRLFLACDLFTGCWITEGRERKRRRKRERGNEEGRERERIDSREKLEQVKR